MNDDDYAYVAAQAEAEGRRRGWNEALEAAQEAVAAVREPYLHPQYDEAISDALAAIKALRGEQ